MKWMTEEYVEEQAAISDEAALLCSVEHYDQMLAASEQEFRDGLKEGLVGISTDYCAICVRRLRLRSHKECPMEQNCRGQCFTEWVSLNRALSPFKAFVWQDVREALVEVRRVLREKHEEVCQERETASEVITRQAAMKERRKKFAPVDICHLRVSVNSYGVEIAPSEKPRTSLFCKQTAENGGCVLTPMEIDGFIVALQSAAAFARDE